MSKSLIPNEKAVIENGWNVMLIGPHGTGKSATVRTMAKRHNLKVAVFNAATMDPHTELLGIPMPRMVQMEDGSTREVLKMIRPVAIDEADIIFLDELNRAPIETQNACMEMANERTINGEPLPNLKCVITAINPPDGNYNVALMDVALSDRWKIYVEVEPVVDPDVLITHDGISEPVAKALAQWYTECDHNKRDTYISPRKVRDLGQVFEKTKSKAMLKQALPPGTTADVGKLFAMLMEAVGTPLPSNMGDKKLSNSGPIDSVEGPENTQGPANTSPVGWVLAKHANPVMIGRVERAAHDYPDQMATHFENLPQSTSYRFGVKLAKMFYENRIVASDVGYTIAAYNRAAKMRGAKTIGDHVEAVSKQATSK